MKYITLNRVFAAYVVLFALVITGVLPRSVVPFVTLGLLAWSLLTSLEHATLFFVRTIPLFIAIPLTASYDNLNMWRLFALLLLFRLLIQRETRQELLEQWHAARASVVVWIRRHGVLRRLLIIGLFAVLSLLAAQHPVTGAVRIIYFVNLLMVPVVVYTLVRRGTLTAEQVIRNCAIPTIIVIVAGFIQLASTYLFDIYGFMRVWGEGIQMRQFGIQWSYIAVWVGNTWLAYYGPQLSLRMFSLFPDSHSFPTFVLLGIPALFAISLSPILAIADQPLKRLVRTYSKLSIVWVPLGFLAAILSGTRGIWAACVGVILLVPCLVLLMRKLQVDIIRRRMFLYMAAYLAAFLLLFGVAWPIFISPQFLIGKADLGLFGNRIRSVLDFGETSNALRIAIWKASLSSIRRHPLLGVGIGNFPVVLDQDIQLARAGSTAHNLYLHVAAEMGIVAALEVILLFIAVWWSAFRWFRDASGASLVYAGSLLLYLPWIFAYVMTDPILFDERVFLFFGTTCALVWAHRHNG